MYDAWVDRAGNVRAGLAAERAVTRLDTYRLAVALQDLDELETAPAIALRRIADSVRTDPQLAETAITEQLQRLPAEQRAAVALALLLAAQRTRH